MSKQIGQFLFDEEITPESIGAARREDIPETYDGNPL